MRLSTAAIHRTSIDSILEQQTRLARTQPQVTSGKRFQTRVRRSDRGDARRGARSHGRGQRAVRAQFEHHREPPQLRRAVAADVTLLLQKSRDLALQGANSTLGQGERNMLVTELRQLRGELVDIANRDDGNGEYLFAGTSTGTRPFARGTTGVNYLGDQTTRFIRVSGSQAIADGHPGTEVFMNLTQANGTFRTAVNPANTGTAHDRRRHGGRSRRPGSPTTTRCASRARPTGSIEDDTLPTPVQVIERHRLHVRVRRFSFLGVRVTLTGTPAAGDSFSVQPAADTDMFAVLDDLIDTLDGGVGLAERSRGVPAADRREHRRPRPGTLARALGARRSRARGSRPSTAPTQARESEAIDLQQLLSDLRDVDYAVAISKLNQEYAGLQAAQAAYTKISQLSLFDYL